jgi:hypothetical protein
MPDVRELPWRRDTGRRGRPECLPRATPWPRANTPPEACGIFEPPEACGIFEVRAYGVHLMDGLRLPAQLKIAWLSH